MHLGDDRAQWGMKAKMIYYEKTVYLESLFDSDRLHLHAGYPFLTPLVQASFFTALDTTDDELAKLPFAMYFISLLLFFYAAQRRFAPHRPALLFTAMLAVLPSFIQDVLGNPASGYADVPLAFYYCIAVWALLNWFEDRQRHHLVLAAVFSVFALYTKQEGLFLWAFMLFGGSIFLAADRARLSRKDFMPFLIFFILLPLVLLLPWLIYQRKSYQNSGCSSGAEQYFFHAEKLEPAVDYLLLSDCAVSPEGPAAAVLVNPAARCM
jgi:hypothetical protein